ncbi:MAG: hypothetical protein BGO39_36650 [Chloroflexi bacterium 54-19]|nr:MAG: hypothetical protein BGO39_36650 [Chloroflexi bacterium 54-19]
MENPDNKSNLPLISVIIPCYNQAHFLAQAIDSVLAQTYPHFEIIVINDGSPDNIQEVMLPYLSDPRIILHNQANQGLSNARNTGIKLAQGQFFQFLDSDDWIAPSKFDLQVNQLLADPSAAFSYCDFYHYHNDTGEIYEMSSDKIGTLEEEPLVKFWSRWLFPPHVILIRREWVERVGEFRTDLPVAEDADYWLRLLALGCQPRHLKEFLAYYRRHPLSLTRVNSSGETAIKIRYLFIQQYPELAARASELGFLNLFKLMNDKDWYLAGLKTELACAKEQIERKEKELVELLAIHQESVTQSEYHYQELMARCTQLESSFKEAERYTLSLEELLQKK